jgi:hypothetical protein
MYLDGARFDSPQSKPLHDCGENVALQLPVEARNLVNRRDSNVLDGAKYDEPRNHET